MDEVARENLMFALVMVAIVSLVISVALGTVAIVAIRELLRIERQQAVKTQPSKELVPWTQRPQHTVYLPGITHEMDSPIRRSTLLAAERRMRDDNWG